MTLSELEIRAERDARNNGFGTIVIIICLCVLFCGTCVWKLNDSKEDKIEVVK